MIRTLFAKTISDAKLLFVAIAILMFVFPWLFVWASGKISVPAFTDFLTRALPKEWQRLGGVSFSQMATPAGRVALVWVHPLIMSAALVWTIARGSDCVSGEIGRGSMEMLLAQPVRRISIYMTHALVTILGSALLAIAVWCGTAIGLSTTALYEQVPAALFIPPAINLFGLMVALSGISALVSACDSQRWRTVGIVGAIYAVSAAIAIAAQISTGLRWLRHFSFLNWYKPQSMVARPEAVWLLIAHRADNTARLGLGGYQIALFALGITCYAVGAVIFTRREIPAPI